MKIVILSGGSGNDALICGLKSLYKDCNVFVIVNAYDNGKSTGVCRKITNTLGVSDIRKNHIRMYKAVSDHVDRNIVEFYENRYDFSSDIITEIFSLLDDWDLSQFKKYVVNFFDRSDSTKFTYNDFNIANIVYSEMYAELGYEVTNRYFCDLLGIDDFVILNSFDNVFINAITSNYNIITDEGDIVEYRNSDDPIKQIFYTGDTKNTLNPVAVDLIQDADLIVISTGTYWSSIYPTLHYANLYKHINNSSAKKLWAINNEEDKDSYGVTSNDFIHYTSKLGLDLSDFIILENIDARESLKEPCEDFKVVYKSMGNSNGKHDGTKFATAIFQCYYGLDKITRNTEYIFDFDDTLWSRSEDKRSVSIDNVKLVNKLKNSIIISGNSYKSIYKKLSSVYGRDIKDFSLDIWADANSTLYRNNKNIQCIKELEFDSYDEIDKIKQYADKYGLNIQASNVCLKIKPLNPLERNILADYLNDYLLKDSKELVAHKTGTTTIDILKKNNSKSFLFNYLNFDGNNTLYIGDEVDSGNDADISKLCTSYIHTSGVEETNLLLRLLLQV